MSLTVYIAAKNKTENNHHTCFLFLFFAVLCVVGVAIFFFHKDQVIISPLKCHFNRVITFIVQKIPKVD